LKAVVTRRSQDAAFPSLSGVSPFWSEGNAVGQIEDDEGARAAICPSSARDRLVLLLRRFRQQVLPRESSPHVSNTEAKQTDARHDLIINSSHQVHNHAPRGAPCRARLNVRARGAAEARLEMAKQQQQDKHCDREGDAQKPSVRSLLVPTATERPPRGALVKGLPGSKRLAASAFPPRSSGPTR
jgi:hypothetical protein